MSEINYSKVLDAAIALNKLTADILVDAQAIVHWGGWNETAAIEVKSKSEDLINALSHNPAPAANQAEEEK